MVNRFVRIIPKKLLPFIMNIFHHGINNVLMLLYLFFLYARLFLLFLLIIEYDWFEQIFSLVLIFSLSNN